MLVLGGKTSDGRILDDALFWTDKAGWERVDTSRALPPARFGASCSRRSETSGVLFGGMDDSGAILQDWWFWSLDNSGSLRWKDCTSAWQGLLGGRTCLYSRFGAQVTTLHFGKTVLIGGILGRGMLTRRTEVVDLDNDTDFRIEGPRPLMTGHSVFGSLILGGGATCFSFGTYWSSSTILRPPPEKEEPPWWRAVAKQEIQIHSQRAGIAVPVTHDRSDGQLPSPVAIPRVAIADGPAFERTSAAARPCIISKADIGHCTSRWTNKYLQHAVGADRKVVVHASSEATMDFQTKNFRYETQSFGSFVDAVERGERLYLRALSKDAPSEQPADLTKDFPGLAADFELPSALAHATENAHSSPLRISGPVNVFLHYDVMANVLCQVRGKKRLLLYPPSDVSHLGLAPGASTSSVDCFNTDIASNPDLQHTHPHEALLEPGEILFIPPLWLHAASPTEGMSVAVNVFFRNLQSGYAAGRDVYGNRDVAAYEKGRKDVAKIAKTFDELPEDMRRFYLERLGGEVIDLARK